MKGFLEFKPFNMYFWSYTLGTTGGLTLTSNKTYQSPGINKIVSRELKGK